MQLWQESNINTQLTLRRNKQEKAEKIIKSFPEAASLFYKMIATNAVSCQPEVQWEYQGSWNMLFEGPSRMEKRH